MEHATIARPYAEAVFRLAEERDDFQQWSDMLQLIAQFAQHPAVQSLVNNPKLTTPEIEAALDAAMRGHLTDAGKKFLTLLLENGRLRVAEDIRAIFEELKAQRLGEVEAHIVSAYEVDDSQLSDLVEVLERRFKRKVKTSIAIDREMIGGLKIQIGDVVIDGTVRGKLDSMASTLKL